MRDSGDAGDRAPSRLLAEILTQESKRRYARELPSATACLQEDSAACIAQLKLPLVHCKAARTTDLLERLFDARRRRSKVIPRAFGERAVMKLIVCVAAATLAVLARAQDHRVRAAATEPAAQGF